MLSGADFLPSGLPAGLLCLTAYYHPLLYQGVQKVLICRDFMDGWNPFAYTGFTQSPCKSRTFLEGYICGR